MRLLRAPDRTDQRIEDVIHHHAPAGYVPCPWMNLLRHIGKSRARARICPGHLAVTDAGEKHRHHGNENCCNNVPFSTIAQDSEYGHRRHGLNYDDTVKNQIPERESPSQTWPGIPCRLVAQKSLLLAEVLRFVSNAILSNESMNAKCYRNPSPPAASFPPGIQSIQ